MKAKAIGLISANYVNGDFGELANRRTLASIPFGGRYRLIDFALSNMANSGITTVGVIAPYNSGSLIDHIGEGTPWSLNRKVGGLFVMPGSVFGITMTGNRFLMRDIIVNKRFFEKDDAEYVVVTGSSDVCNIDYKPILKAHEESGKPITLVTKRVTDAENYRGFFVKKDENSKVIEMDKRSAGDADYFMDLLIVDRKFLIDFIGWFETLEYMDFMDIVSNNIDRFDIGAYQFEGYYGKVNSLQNYWKVNMDLLNKQIKKELFLGERTIYTKVQDVPPAAFKVGSNIKNSLIAAGSEIEGTVENSIIFRSCHIGKGAVIKNSIIMQHGIIGDGAVLDKVILDKYVTINDGVQLSSGEKVPIIVGKGKSV